MHCQSITYHEYHIKWILMLHTLFIQMSGDRYVPTHICLSEDDEVWAMGISVISPNDFT